MASKPIITLTPSPIIDLAFPSREIRPIRKIRAIGQRTDAGDGGQMSRVLKELSAEARGAQLDSS
jgi:6-phosphofructokinase 2